jgi:cytosine/adenosine deaminase-related metal-dependent hydrolase
MLAPRTLKLVGARVTRSALATERLDLVIREGRIVPTDSFVRGVELDLSGCLLLPGLINAHDHLEFNLFPRLGKGPYGNAVEWARDIYRPGRSPVKEHLAVPKFARLLWGGIKNLLSGVTTVAHHNPYEPRVFDVRFPVRVVRNFGWAHSLHFSHDLVERFRNTPRDWPFVIHAAEGRDSSAYSEIARLDALGVLDKQTVLVHAVALSPQDIAILEARKCSVVWCPSSNLFTCGETITSRTMESEIPIALGTDSAITANGDIVDEINTARTFPQITRQRLFEMVTTRAAAIFRLPDGAGEIKENGPADLVAIRDTGRDPGDAVADLCPELVMIDGLIRLISRRLLAANPHFSWRSHGISIPGRGEWLIDVDTSFLRNATTRVLGSRFFLAGKRVLV